MSIISLKIKNTFFLTSDSMQTTKPYLAMAFVAERLRGGATKVLDFVLPKNEMTNNREIRFIPVSFEKWIGKSIYDTVCPRAKISKDAALNAKVKEVFDRLIAQCPRKNLDWEIRVSEDANTVNAFCTPGGKVVITTALINKMNETFSFDRDFAGLTFEDNLAAVLGHEIVHAAAGHGARSIQLSLIAFIAGKIASFVIPTFLFKKNENATSQENAQVESKRKMFSRGFDLMYTIVSKLFIRHHCQSHELESDKWGIKLAYQAGYNIDASIRLQHIFLEMKGKKDGDKSGNLEKITEITGTHPPSQVRLDTNRRTIAEIRQNS